MNQSPNIRFELACKAEDGLHDKRTRGEWLVRGRPARPRSRPDLFQDGGEAVAGAAEFEAHLLARPLVVTGEVAALGPPAFGVGVEGESGVRLGGDGEDFIGPLHRPAADEGAGLPARRRAGDEGLRKGARRGLARGGHGISAVRSQTE